MIRDPSDSGQGPVWQRHGRWLVPALGLLLLGAACAGGGAPGLEIGGSAPARAVIEATVAPQFTGDAFVTADGARLPLRKWLPKEQPKAVILALHGFGDYSHAFEEPGKRWAARGIATYAYDQRGFGGAPGRGEWPGEALLAVDAVSASQILRRAYPGRPLYILGESMGGAVAALAATGAMHGVLPTPDGPPVADVDGVILSAPAVWGRAIMEALPKIALWAGVRFLPTTVLTGQGLKIQASDNIPMLQALARDPLVIKGARVDTVYGLVNIMDSALEAAPQLQKPMLLLYGTHDQIIPPAAIEAFVAHLPADPDHRERFAYYQHGYHLLLRDLDGPAVADDVAAWIFDHAARLPSHSDAAETIRPWPPAKAESG